MNIIIMVSNIHDTFHTPISAVEMEVGMAYDAFCINNAPSAITQNQSKILEAGFLHGCSQPLYCFHFNNRYVTLNRYIYMYIQLTPLITNSLYNESPLRNTFWTIENLLFIVYLFLLQRTTTTGCYN